MKRLLIVGLAALALMPSFALASETTVTLPVGNWLLQSVEIINNVALPVIMAIVLMIAKHYAGPFGAILTQPFVEKIIGLAVQYALNQLKIVSQTPDGKPVEITLNARSEFLAKALTYIETHAGGWLKSYMGPPELIEQKIIARVKLVTG